MPVPVVEQHEGSRPESCEVCRYLDLHTQLDRMLQHTLTMLAGWMLLEDLEASGGSPLSMRSIYVERFAADSPGQPAPLEPHYWMLALLAAPEIKFDHRDDGGTGMTNKQPTGARETYEAYREGEITPAQAARRAQDWYASHRETPAKSSKKR